MDHSFFSHPRWAIIEGFPFLLSVWVWIILFYSLVKFLFKARSNDFQAQISLNQRTRKQNFVYKRAGALLLILGAIGGFLPSILMLLFTGKVYSVNEQGPHPSVDLSLYVHIPLAVLWTLTAGIQLWSGQVARRRRIHKIVGWFAAVAVVLGIGLIGGYVWPLLNDFSQGLASPTAGAGIYTMLTGLGVVINGSMTIWYAKKKQYALHKDHALMTLFWTMDPGLHRLWMWLMRLFCWDCWAPETTGDLGIAIAKLPANLGLILWAILMASYAFRVNRVIFSNVAGQFILWCLGTHALLQIYMGNKLAKIVVLASLILGILTLLAYRYNKRSFQKGLLNP